jgi:LuxR family quorum-sensing system transcriptional regulator CciR
MVSFERAEPFLRNVTEIANETDLADALREISGELGFSYFALSQHVDFRRLREPGMRLHNYPDEWAEYYDGNGFGLTDPVHRASQVTSVGFAWSRLPGMIDLTPADREMLVRAEAQGIGDGFTVPAHVPGEVNGSCSFANPKGVAISEEHLPLAQLVGAFAFEAARRLWRVRSPHVSAAPRLTDRQRECVLWVARGKSDWEISRILGVRHDTVVRHLKQARERYGVGKRTLLAVQALFDGSISFTDVLKP